jgi:hypothetical protein
MKTLIQCSHEGMPNFVVVTNYIIFLIDLQGQLGVVVVVANGVLSACNSKGLTRLLATAGSVSQSKGTGSANENQRKQGQPQLVLYRSPKGPDLQMQIKECKDNCS